MSGRFADLGFGQALALETHGVAAKGMAWIKGDMKMSASVAGVPGRWGVLHEMSG